MSHILEFLRSHVSVRQFTDEPVTEEQERLIVSTGQRSPTSSNMQAYSVIAVRNQQSKARIAEWCGNQQHVIDCPLFLIFCADLFRLKGLNERRGYPFEGGWTEAMIIATVDTALAAGRALQAAQAIGLGGVMVGSIRNRPDEVCRLTAAPELVYPVMGMSIGHPLKPGKTKPRLPLEAVWCREKYCTDRFAEAIGEYDRTIAEGGHLAGRPVRPELYPEFTGTYSWSEHTARRMADDTPSTIRAHMKEFLQKRGFMLK